jgi:hypothetical protein
VLHAYDLRLARRSLVLSALALCAAVVVVVATDEGGGALRRLALCAATSPVAGGLGALFAARIARARGEARALEAIGAHPTRALLGATLGGALVAATGPAIVLAGVADLEPLFPRPADAFVWVAEPDGGMREVMRGVRVGPGGVLVVSPSEAVRRDVLPDEDRTRAVAFALALLALVVPLWVTVEGQPAGKAVAFALVGVAMVAAFQLVGARRVSPWIVGVPPLALLAHALASRYRAPPSA